MVELMNGHFRFFSCCIVLQSFFPFIYLSFKFPFAVRCLNELRMRISTKSKRRRSCVNRFGQWPVIRAAIEHALTLTDINHNVLQNEMQTTNRNPTLFHCHCSNGVVEVVRAKYRKNHVRESSKLNSSLLLENGQSAESAADANVFEKVQTTERLPLVPNDGNKTKSWVER